MRAGQAGRISRTGRMGENTNLRAGTVRVCEITSRTILSKSGIAPYALNPYRGCSHGCIYCYAVYTKRFTGHAEPWGHFVDVKSNAARLLEQEVRKKKRDTVMMSSVCDAWQPIEEKYRLSRECVRILVENGFPVSILTKSALVARDLDILSSSEDSELGFTITTADDKLAQFLEPGASPPSARLAAIDRAAAHGISVWCFVGPLLPKLSDTEENIARLMRRLSELPLKRICVDTLNCRPLVWPRLARSLSAMDGRILDATRRAAFSALTRGEYRNRIKERFAAVVSRDTEGILSFLF